MRFVIVSFALSQEFGRDAVRTGDVREQLRVNGNPAAQHTDAAPGFLKDACNLVI